MADPWALRSAPWRRLGLGRGLRSPWRTKTPRSRSPQISKFASSNYLFFSFEFLFALRIVHGPRSMNFLPLKPCRPLGCHAKLTLESHADPPDGTFVEKTPDQGKAVRYARRRVELWHRIRGVPALRRNRSVWTKSTGERNLDCLKILGQASGTCILSWFRPPFKVSSSKAAAASAKRITFSES